jgi:hypothetical protein
LRVIRNVRRGKSVNVPPHPKCYRTSEHTIGNGR